MIDLGIEKIKIQFNMFSCKYHFGKVGKHSWIRNPMRIIGGKYVTIGKNTSILNNLRLEVYKSSKGVRIGNNCNVEQNVHITCASGIDIGDECSILAGTMITDITHPYENINIAPKDQEIATSPVMIGKQTMIGMGARILPGVTIGKHCVIGTNAVVSKNIPDYCVAVGIPAKIIKKYNTETKHWDLIVT